MVTGTQGTLTPRGSASLADYLAQHEDAADLESVRDATPSSPRTPLDAMPEYAQRRASPPDHPGVGGDMLKLAARTVSEPTNMGAAAAVVVVVVAAAASLLVRQTHNRRSVPLVVAGHVSPGEPPGSLSDGWRRVAASHDGAGTPRHQRSGAQRTLSRSFQVAQRASEHGSESLSSSTCL